MGTHYTEYCRQCGIVISQCRCHDPHKEIRYGLCDACAGTQVRTANLGQKPGLMPTLWWENDKGDKWVGDHPTDTPPSEYIYMHSRFPSLLRTNVLRMVVPEEVAACKHPPEDVRRTYGWIDGVEGRECSRCKGTQTKNIGDPWPTEWDAYGSREFFNSESTYPSDLVMAMVRISTAEARVAESKYGTVPPPASYDDAVILAATACERCMNALADRYGLDWGYAKDSAEWVKSNTRCMICDGSLGDVWGMLMNGGKLPLVARVAAKSQPGWDNPVLRQILDGKDPAIVVLVSAYPGMDIRMFPTEPQDEEHLKALDNYVMGVFHGEGIEVYGPSKGGAPLSYRTQSSWKHIKDALLGREWNHMPFRLVLDQRPSSYPDAQRHLIVVESHGQVIEAIKAVLLAIKELGDVGHSTSIDIDGKSVAYIDGDGSDRTHEILVDDEELLRKKEASSMSVVHRVIERHMVKRAVEIGYGTGGLDLTWQAPWEPTTECCRCGSVARIALVVAEGTNSQESRYVTDLHHNDPKGEGFWLHDAAAFAIYLCTNIKCAGATTLWNQG